MGAILATVLSLLAFPGQPEAGCPINGAIYAHINDEARTLQIVQGAEEPGFPNRIPSAIYRDGTGREVRLSMTFTNGDFIPILASDHDPLWFRWATDEQPDIGGEALKTLYLENPSMASKWVLRQCGTPFSG